MEKPQIIILPVDALRPAPWNYKHQDNEMQQKLENNIRRNGVLLPCLVREIGDGLYEVVDGNHRLLAYEHLGITRVACVNLGAISAAEAKRIAIEINETRFPAADTLLAEIVEELKVEFPLEDLQATLPTPILEIGEIIDLDLDDDLGLEGSSLPSPGKATEFRLSFSSEEEAERVQYWLDTLVDRYEVSGKNQAERYAKALYYFVTTKEE
ncbi:MAG: hypothetical protein DRO04_00035 [Candidatus Iainarchaeum archaeon]|uniref:ParB-like N-terminal domain-containing protein n=1 Tax=Candidatus Iainarchaeum sp. TaxID=3101447 RepID=A0A497JI73_9ARCH|nr:MAG: hypothetical protein DRO04_00035 [Candidatus Diapherotrites archaeon]